MHADEIRGRIVEGLPHAKAIAMRSGAEHAAWHVVADAEAYMRGAPTFVPPERIVEELDSYRARGD